MCKRLLVCALAAAVLPCVAQETRGAILGRVTDPSGAVVVGAKVEAINSGTNVVSAGVTNGSGDYSFPFLISGDYTVKVHLDGFHDYVQEHIAVTIDDKVAINVALQMGAASETVKVTASDSLVSVDAAS